MTGLEVAEVLNRHRNGEKVDGSDPAVARAYDMAIQMLVAGEARWSDEKHEAIRYLYCGGYSDLQVASIMAALSGPSD